MVGTLIELGEAINRTHYSKQTPAEQTEEEKATRMRFRSFRTWLASNFVTFIDEKWVSVDYVFNRHLLELASGVYCYIRDRPGYTNASAPKCTDDAFKSVVLQQLRKNYPELVPKFQALLVTPRVSLVWTGPPLSISPRARDPESAIFDELIELPSDPIYLRSSAEEDVDMTEDVASAGEHQEAGVTESEEGEEDHVEEDGQVVQPEAEREGSDGEDEVEHEGDADYEDSEGSTSRPTKRGKTAVGRKRKSMQGAVTPRPQRPPPGRQNTANAVGSSSGSGAARQGRPALVGRSNARGRSVRVASPITNSAQGGDVGQMQVDTPALPRRTTRSDSRPPGKLTTGHFHRLLTTVQAPTPPATVSELPAARKRRRAQ
jgi:hypothetical protein